MYGTSAQNASFRQMLFPSQPRLGLMFLQPSLLSDHDAACARHRRRRTVVLSNRVAQCVCMRSLLRSSHELS